MPISERNHAFRDSSRLSRAGFVAAVLVALTACGGDDGGQGDQPPPTIQTLSSRPDTVSGGDALVAVTPPAGVATGDVKVVLNGADVSSAFAADATGRMVGLVSGLQRGDNLLVANAKGGTAAITLTDHSITGPIFSGPQQTPFVCETAFYALPDGSSLGPATDAQCSVATRVVYAYRSTAGTLKPLPDPATRPTDLARTTTLDGRSVNYIVRLEVGTINRAIYEIAMLHDPVVDPAPSRANRPAGWNGRLIYTFGGNCNVGYHQGRATGGVLNDLQNMPMATAYLARGYAVASSSLNVLGTMCNDVLSAETLSMVKERFVETFGAPRYTIGSGGSGGAMQQHQITQNYPGLLDGIIPARSYPDMVTFLSNAYDCRLLHAAITSSTQHAWTNDEKTAVAGSKVYEWCSEGSAAFGRLTSARRMDSVTGANCSPLIAESLIYDPIANPRGIRCTWHDNLANLLGRDARTGFVPRPFDNVGIQYGLKAFNAGRITFDMFADLNARVGGFDVDGNIVPARMSADRDALRRSYQFGRVNEKRGALGDVPIVDYRTYLDDVGDLHDAVRSHLSRARLIAANGDADNQIIVTGDRFGTGAGSDAAVAGEMLRIMESWLAAIAADGRPGSAHERVVRNKPAEAVDACYTATGQKITDMAECGRRYPLFGMPRLVAGEPMTEDRLKCALKPVSRADYVATISDAQLARIASIFPDGVCDYAKAGIEQQPIVETWHRY